MSKGARWLGLFERRFCGGGGGAEGVESGGGWTGIYLKGRQKKMGGVLREPERRVQLCTTWPAIGRTSIKLCIFDIIFHLKMLRTITGKRVKLKQIEPETRGWGISSIFDEFG